MPLFTVGEVLTAALMNAVQGAPTTKSGAYTAVDGDVVFMSGGHVVTLPAVASQAKVSVTATDANIANGLTAAGSAKIIGLGLGSGTAAGTLVPLGAIGASIEVQCDGTNWYVVSGEVDSGWITVANGSMSNSWVNGTPAFAYRLQGDMVRLRGQLASGLASQPILTFPVGFRPVNQIALTNGYNAGQTETIIATTGVMTTSASAPTFVLMDNITFLVD